MTSPRVNLEGRAASPPPSLISVRGVRFPSDDLPLTAHDSRPMSDRARPSERGNVMIAPSPERTSTAETPALEPEPVETFTAAELLEIILDACVHLDPKECRGVPPHGRRARPRGGAHQRPTAGRAS